MRAVRKSRWNDRRNPVLAGRALSILEACLSPKALLHRQTWTLIDALETSKPRPQRQESFQQTTHTAPPRHAGFGVLTHSSFSLILADISLLASAIELLRARHHVIPRGAESSRVGCPARQHFDQKGLPPKSQRYCLER